jgi:signal transduction histidine kinase/CheY-like chemotaxis protein
MTALPFGSDPALLDAIERLAAAGDTARILSVVRETGRAAIRCDALCLMLRDPAGFHVAVEDAAGSSAPGCALLRDAGLASMAIEQKRVLLVPDVYRSELLGLGLLGTGTVRSLAVVPLGSPAPFGVLVAGWAEPHAAGGDVVQALEILARAVGRGLEVARLIDALPNLLFTSRSDGSCEHLGRQWTEYGIETTQSGPEESWLDRLVHPDDRDDTSRLWIAALAEQRVFETDHRLRHGDGHHRWFRTRAMPMRNGDGRVTHWTGSCTDIHSLVEARHAETQKRQALERHLREEVAERGGTEARLARTERIEAIGQLTSGVAHDFNNLLTVIIGNIEFLEASVRSGDTLDDRACTRLATMREAAERGGNLTHQLLAFARRQRLDPKPIDLNATVSELHGLLMAAIGGGNAVHTILASGLWSAFADRTQIERMILNLAANAHDAMEVGGLITVATRNRAVASAEADLLGLPCPGDFVEISVTDTGRGMHPQVLARAFEPFFTTKPPGTGSGLGLAQVYGFAQQSGGIVTLRSAPGEGTCVAILLPRAASPARIEAPPAVTPPSADHAPHPLSPDSAAALPKPERLVLLVDDDLAVREVTSTIVAEAGYRVIEAASGQDALDHLRTAGPVDLMVTDYAMPGMNGFELARAAQARQSGLKVLFVTGYADLTALGDIAEDRILLKPFRSARLLDKISVALGD